MLCLWLNGVLRLPTLQQTDEERRQLIAIGHLSDSGDLKIQCN